MHTESLDQIVERELASGLVFGAFHRQWLQQRAPHRVQEYLRKSVGSPIMGVRQGFAAMDVNDVNTADFNARNTTASEINILGSDINGTTPQAMINQYCAIAANDARAGKVYRVTAGGIYGTTGTPTIIWTPRWGSSTTVATNVSLGVSSTYTTASGVSAQPWFGEFIFTIRTAPPGATLGTGKGHGYIAMGISAATGAILTMGKTAATIDTTGQGTAGCGLTLNITWGTSNASNTLTCENYILASMN
jgi:hypothetical protein